MFFWPFSKGLLVYCYDVFHSPVNTLYLKLQCPAVRPPLVVTSNNGHSVVDFHQVIVGERLLPKHEACLCFLPLS